MPEELPPLLLEALPLELELELELVLELVLEEALRLEALPLPLEPELEAEELPAEPLDPPLALPPPGVPSSRAVRPQPLAKASASPATNGRRSQGNPEPPKVSAAP
jgi:hypothetical protein